MEGKLSREQKKFKEMRLEIARKGLLFFQVRWAQKEHSLCSRGPRWPPALARTFRAVGRGKSLQPWTTQRLSWVETFPIALWVIPLCHLLRNALLEPPYNTKLIWASRDPEVLGPSLGNANALFWRSATHILLLRTQKYAIVKKPVGLCLMHHFQDFTWSWKSFSSKIY